MIRPARYTVPVLLGLAVYVACFVAGVLVVAATI